MSASPVTPLIKEMGDHLYLHLLLQKQEWRSFETLVTQAIHK